MEHPWGMDYQENGVVSRGNLYVTNHHSVKASPDAPTLAICIPSRGSVPIELFMAMKRMAVPINTQALFYYTRGMMGTSGRDHMTKQALAHNVDFIYFADDDVLPPPDVLYKMMRHMQMDPTIGLITGVYTTKNVPPHPHIYKERNGAHYWGFSMSPYDAPEDIWGCGAGCLMVRTEAISKMTEPYWAEHVDKRDDNSIAVLGHDLLFCQKVRDAGYRTVVDGSIQCDHFDSATNRYYRLPKNSAPVVRHLNDPRNHEYWANWWGVSPNGEGHIYEELLRFLERIEFTEPFALVNACGGVTAQVLHNLYPGTYAGLIPSDSSEEAYCRARRLPMTELGSVDLVVIEPETLPQDHPVWEYVSNNPDRCLVITRKVTERFIKRDHEGEWYAYRGLSSGSNDDRSDLVLHCDGSGSGDISE